MGDNTGIEWTDASWTPIRARNRATGKVGWHCTHASEGCRHCYAESRNGWIGTGLPFKPGHEKDVEIFLDEAMLLQPLRWKRPRMIFVCSMTDLFADFVPDDWIDKIFAIMALAPQHTFQVLTKRSKRMQEYMAGEGISGGRSSMILVELMGSIAEAEDSFDLQQRIEERLKPPPLADRWPLPNVWLGVSTEDQARANERIPDLLATPAAVRFVSAEPLLGPINLELAQCNCPSPADAIRTRHLLSCPADRRPYRRWSLDWVIAGGESGPHARPMHPDWARIIRNQCAAAGVPFFFKQWGELAPVYDRDAEDHDWQRCSEVERQTPRGRWLNLAGGHGFHGERVVRVDRIGKKAAGRILDGREHNEMPKAIA